MRTVTVAAVVVLLLGLAAAALLAFAGGGGSADGLEELWMSDTGGDRAANHHAPAAGSIGGRGMVYAPISGAGGTDQCHLVALHGENGSVGWNYPIPPEVCTIHAVADPTIADYDGDGTPEVLVATTEQAVVGLHPFTGEVEFRADLTSYGYTRPIVADFTGDGASEVVAVDVQGSVFVFRANGTVVWQRQSSSYTWGQPAVADFDGDGEPELAVGFGGSGAVTLFESDGSVAWTRSEPVSGSITWIASGQAADRPGAELAVATTDGVVAVIDGRDGRVRWSQDLGTLAAVHAFGDGDGDGEAEVYAVAKDGVLRSYAASDGSVEWTTALAAEDVQMTPPPTMGDVDGDGRPELVAVTNDGAVSVVDPTDGTIVGTYRRDVPIWVHPTIADVDGDGVAEAIVIYGDGRVVALSP